MSYKKEQLICKKLHLFYTNVATLAAKNWDNWKAHKTETIVSHVSLRGWKRSAERHLARISDYHESFWEQQLPNAMKEQQATRPGQNDLSVRRE